MLKLKKIAVTGGLSAGKSTVCEILKELGAYLVSADKITHQLLSPGTATAQKIVNLLGSDVINGNELDRKKIAAKVFSEPNLLDALEKIIHPAVFNEIEQKYKQASQEKKHTLFVAEIPLLYEAEEENAFDVIIAVNASEDLCRKRYVEKTHRPDEEFDKRMLRQISPEHKAKKAHYAIQNNGSFEELKNEVKTIYLQLTQDNPSSHPGPKGPLR